MKDSKMLFIKAFETLMLIISCIVFGRFFYKNFSFKAKPQLPKQSDLGSNPKPRSLSYDDRSRHFHAEIGLSSNSPTGHSFLFSFVRQYALTPTPHSFLTMKPSFILPSKSAISFEDARL